VLAGDLPGLRVVVPVAPNLPESLVNSLCDAAGFHPVLVPGRAREVLQAADAALVASGTATLEATLAEVPHVVAYRTGWSTYLTWKFFVRARRIALPNILAAADVVPELLQGRANADALARTVRPLLVDGPARVSMVAALSKVRASLGTPGASSRVASLVLGRALPPLDSSGRDRYS